MQFQYMRKRSSQERQPASSPGQDAAVLSLISIAMPELALLVSVHKRIDLWLAYCEKS